MLVLDRAGWPAHDVPPDPAATPLGPAFVWVRADADDHPGLATLAHAAVKVATGRTSATAVLFLTPEGFPFAASGPLPLVQLLAWAAQLDAGWQQQRPTLLANAQRLAATVAAPPTTTGQLSAELVGEAIGVLSGRLDPRHEPAFLAVDALLRWHRRNGSQRALHGAESALGALLSGALADRASGGFFAQLDPANPGQAWPFKPVALNALAARTLVLAWRITGRAVYRHAAETTLAWLTGAPAQRDCGLDAANQPDRDDRRLLAANALLLGTLAATATALSRPDLAVAAHDLGQHLLEWPRDADGRLLHRHPHPGEAATPAPAGPADLAALLDGLLSVAKAQPEDTRWLAAATTTARDLQGALAAEEPSLALAQRLDGDLPATAGLAATGLRRLGILTGDRALVDAATALLGRHGAPALADPVASASVISALTRTLATPFIDLTESPADTPSPPALTVAVIGPEPAATEAAAAIGAYAHSRGVTLLMSTAAQPAASPPDLLLALGSGRRNGALGDAVQFTVREFVRLGLDAPPRSPAQPLRSWLGELHSASRHTVDVLDEAPTGEELALLAEGVAYVLSRSAR